MAYLPSVLGFTSSYVITLAANLSLSLIVDAKGLAGYTIPISFSRAAALVLVLCGSILFNSRKSKEEVSNFSETDLSLICADEEDVFEATPVSRHACEMERESITLSRVTYGS